jgi:hypothetical protein
MVEIAADSGNRSENVTMERTEALNVALGGKPGHNFQRFTAASPIPPASALPTASALPRASPIPPATPSPDLPSRPEASK